MPPPLRLLRYLRSLRGRASTGRPKRCQPGAVLVEFSQALGMLVILVLIGVQFALIVTQYYSAMLAARQTARWLAVRPDTVDSAVIAQVNTVAASLPGLSDGGISSITINPGCPTLVSGRCPGRQSGNPVSISILPNLGRVMFLPTSFGLGDMRVSFMPTLPAYTVSIMLE